MYASTSNWGASEKERVSMHYKKKWPIYNLTENKNFVSQNTKQEKFTMPTFFSYNLKFSTFYSLSVSGQINFLAVEKYGFILRFSFLVQNHLWIYCNIRIWKSQNNRRFTGNLFNTSKTNQEYQNCPQIRFKNPFYYMPFFPRDKKYSSFITLFICLTFKTWGAILPERIVF